MIRITFHEREATLCGFTIVGHAGAGVAGQDIVCAAVSSAAYLVANTLTEICRCGATAEADEGFMRVTVKEPDKCADLLAGLQLHFSQLRQQYPDRITICTEIMEV